MKNTMKKYEVIEDSGGGLHLAIFSGNNSIEYLHSGYEYVKGQLQEDLEALKRGDNPAEDWEGNSEKPQEEYNDMTSYEYGWEVVADNEGIYPEKMGCAACVEFGISTE